MESFQNEKCTEYILRVIKVNEYTNEKKINVIVLFKIRNCDGYFITGASFYLGSPTEGMRH